MIMVLMAIPLLLQLLPLLSSTRAPKNTKQNTSATTVPVGHIAVGPNFCNDGTWLICYHHDLYTNADFHQTIRMDRW